jgi:hypothetical protein
MHTALEAALGARRLTLGVSDERPILVLDVDGATVAEVALGIEVDGVDLGIGATIVSAERSTIREEWNAFTGKATGLRRVEHEQLSVTMRTAATDWETVLRVAADGFAFRYVLPEGAQRLGTEHTRVLLDPRSRAWVLDYQTWYETPRFGADLADLPEGDYGFPTLIETPGGRYVLLSESAIDGRSSGAHAVYDEGSFVITTADPVIEVEPRHATPWRVVFAGSLSDIVSSTFVDDLAPAAPADLVPPRPGRAAWSWWSSQYSGAYLDVQKRFTDFAAEQGWEHVLVDCGWDPAWVPELVSYASARGVQVHLWSSWSDLVGEEALRSLGLWRSWGVAGIKVDFMESEAQERYRWYDAIIAESARVGLMVNFHGSVIPRGWARTHPHIVSYEGIRGAEYYVFYGEPLTAAHNVIQPFTRNVVGSMDYTPVAFGAPRRETTEAHELALGVVYESGITHFADDPDEYRRRPAAASFLSELPASWDEVRLLAGHPDTHALLARRAGERWFIGCIGARADETTVEFDPAALIGEPADLWTIGDGDGQLEEHDARAVTAPIEMRLAPRGGFVAVVAPTGTPLRTSRARPVLPGPTVPDELIAYRGEPLVVNTDAVAIRLPEGWSAEKTRPGTWTIIANRPMPAGSVAVAGFEAPGHDGLPVIAHARIVIPIDEGTHVVSTLPFLSARNAVGPVERDLANGGGDPRDGATLRVRGREFADGLGVSQESEIRFAVAGAARRLTGSVAIDDETPDASGTVEVLVDDRSVVRFALAAASDPIPFDIDITDATTLTLRTSPADTGEAHIDWLTLRLS